MAEKIPEFETEFSLEAESMIRSLKRALQAVFGLGYELGKQEVCEHPEDYDLQPNR